MRKCNGKRNRGPQPADMPVVQVTAGANVDIKLKLGMKVNVDILVDSVTEKHTEKNKRYSYWLEKVKPDDVTVVTPSCSASASLIVDWLTIYSKYVDIDLATMAETRGVKECETQIRERIPDIQKMIAEGINSANVRGGGDIN